MDLFMVTLIVIILCVLLNFYFKEKLSYFKKRGIPNLPTWPVLGCMGDAILHRKHISDIVYDIYNVDQDAKYVGLFDLNMRPIIMLRDPELIKEISIKNFDNFADRKTYIDASIDPIFGGNLFHLRGLRWKKARSLLTPAFTSSKMKSMFELMKDCVENLTDYIAKQKKESLKMVDTKDLFSRLTVDVIGTCAFGVNVDSLNEPKNDFYVWGKKATNLEGLQMVKFFLARLMPRVLKFFNVKFLDSRVENFFLKLVSDTIAVRAEKNISRPDMLQLMIDAQRDETGKRIKLNTLEMTAQAFIFFFGGFDTTSTQMCLTAHELAINPEVQSRLQEEIDEVLKKGSFSYETINEMPYLDAVFNESMRLHVQSPGVQRNCAKAYELPPTLPGTKPFVIEAGTDVWIPSIGIHKDPKYYENPDKFDPDRFYCKKVGINDVFNMGFGIGPRACIGNRFAILQIKLLFFRLLSKFNLKPNGKTCVPLVYAKKSFLLKPDEGFWLEIEPRN